MHLSDVHGNDAPIGFQLDDHRTVDHKVEPVFPEHRRTVPDLDGFLAIDVKAAVLELQPQRSAIDAFNEAGA